MPVFFPLLHSSFEEKMHLTKKPKDTQRMCNENGVSSQPLVSWFPFPEAHSTMLLRSIQYNYACTPQSFLWSCGYKLFGWNGPYLCTEVSYLEFINALGAKLGRILYKYQMKNSLFYLHIFQEKSSRTAGRIFLYIVGRSRGDQNIQG